MHGVLPQRFGPSPPHTMGGAHDLQSIIPPQPSGSMPQFALADSQVLGLQPHLLGTPAPPQVVPGSRHVPQSIIMPQPSETIPHSAARSGQVNGMHPHFFDIPPPPHVSGSAQCPHSTVSPQPS